MSLKSRFAIAVLLATLATASPPALAACGDAGEVVDAACVAREAVEAARQAAHPQSRIQLLSEAARHLPGDEATPLLIEARAMAEAVEDPGNRSLALMHVAGIMSDMGMADGPILARELAASIFEDGPNDRTLIEILGQEAAATRQIWRIARFQALNGDKLGAEIAIGYQQRETDKVDTMFIVAGALAERGDEAADSFLRKAMRRLGNIDDPARTDQIKLTATEALMQAGWVDEALALAETTAEITPRMEAIGIVVERLAAAGEVERAREQFDRIAGLSANDKALNALAIGVARAGNMDEVRNMLRDIQWQLGRDQAVGDLAGIQAGQGDLNGALDIIADLPEGFARNRGLRLVLTGLIESGRPDLAEDYAAGLADPGLRNLIIAPIAATRARAGEHARALETARAQPTPNTQARTLLAIAEALVAMEKAQAEKPDD